MDTFSRMGTALIPVVFLLDLFALHSFAFHQSTKLYRLPFTSTKIRSFTSSFQGGASSALNESTSSENSAVAVAPTSVPIGLTLTKPLGLILEENTEGGSDGTYVLEVGDGGSAYADPNYGGEALVGKNLLSIDGTDVSGMTFDDVMDTIIGSKEDTVFLTFGEKGMIYCDEAGAEDGGSTEKTNEFEIGTQVTITVIQEGVPTRDINGRVGDNLRKTLLDNKVELYRGMKKKFGNCGGGGQCTFCAVDFVESDGWLERSDYEDSRLGKFPTARLACLNNIAGPATIRVQ